MLQLPILSILIFIPIFSSLYITLFIGHFRSANKDRYAIYVAILGAFFTVLSSIYLLLVFDSQNPNAQFIEHYTWIQTIGLEFYVGVDGLSLFFIVLTSVLSFFCIILSLFTIKKQIKEFLLCILLLEAFCLGAFCALNLLLFYMFFETILIPMFLIIGIWGYGDRVYAATKFFIYTFCGSLIFLIVIIYLYTSAHSFNLDVIANVLQNFDIQTQRVLWISIFIAFAVKIPIPPFHTWLPDAHVQAPTVGSVMLAAILLKLGSYAFLRILLPLLPEVSKEFSTYVLYASAFSIIYASLIAFAQNDMKKMIAYSSIAHMGFVVGGVFSCTKDGIKGAIFQMISHALISSALFTIVGCISARGRTKEINSYGQVATKMPLCSVVFLVSVLGSIGMPGTSGFIGELFSIFGIFIANPITGIISAFGIVLSAVYMLTLYKKVMLGNMTNTKINTFDDLNMYERLVLIPLAILIVFCGIYPNVILDKIDVSVNNLLKLL